MIRLGQIEKQFHIHKMALTVMYDRVLDELRERDSGTITAEELAEVMGTSFLFNLNNSITGLSNEFGACATPATMVINNVGEPLILE